jgi:hypothetical protein
MAVSTTRRAVFMGSEVLLERFGIPYDATAKNSVNRLEIQTDPVPTNSLP